MIKPLMSLPTNLWCHLRRALPAFVAALACALPQLSQADLGSTSVKTDQVSAELLAHAPQGVSPGQSFWLGLQLKHAPHWHTYWQNPGDSGLPTQLQWQFPAGLSAGDIAWPVPKKIPIGTLANYGYEGSTLLTVPVTVAPDFKAPLLGPLQITLHAQWLACRQECIPQEGKFTLKLPVQSATALHGEAFDAARQSAPQLLPQQQQAGTWITGGQTTLTEQGQQLQLRVHGLPVDWRGQTLSAFPVSPSVVDNAAVQGKGWTARWQGGVWEANIPISSERLEQPRTMRWVIALGPETAPKATAFEVETPVLGQWPASSAPPGVSPELAQALARNAANTATAPPTTLLGLALAVLGALLGGLLLNLMPCVFPVLAIKVMGFAQPGQSRTAHRSAGLAYTAGVVLSFVLLGAFMLGLRATGEQLGWGFQLQSPGVVVALAVLFTLLGLNLAGVFEVGMLVPSRLASWQSQRPAVNAALSGVLAVAVASPCTAPFMGASLGLAIALPAWQALSVFAAMGLGMALPYLAASLWPGLAKVLPRPGAWMVVFRQAMAFPMFATVIWLVWVLGQQTGIDGASALLALLLVCSLCVWAWGLTGRARWVLGTLALLGLVWLGTSVLPTALQNAPAAADPTLSTDSASPTTARWQAWSESRLQTELAAGRPVFVDFTAAWCVTCQYNKKTTLSDPSLLADFDTRKVTLLRADWTRRDAAITQALTALGRSGVPVYALYVPGKAPVILSELPSVAEVQTALRGL